MIHKPLLIPLYLNYVYVCVRTTQINAFTDYPPTFPQTTAPIHSGKKDNISRV